MIRNIGNEIAAALLLRKITKEYPDREILILGLPGIGDLLWESTFLKSYYSEKNANALPLCSEKNAFVLEDMGITEYIAVSDDKMRILDAALLQNYLAAPVINNYINKRKIRVLIFEFYINYRKNKGRIPWLDELTVMRYLALELTEDTAKLQYPRVELQYDPLEKYGIKAPFAIINPYSNTQYIEKSIFEETARRLSGLGYTVYANLCGSQEEIKGTVPLRCTVRELFVIAAAAGMVVSQRSGILDYIVSNTPNIIVIYEQLPSYYRNTLKQWRTEANIKELIYSGDKGELLKEIEAAIDSISAGS